MRSFLSYVFLLTLLTALVAVADVVRVPQDAPTIQAGMNTIQDGDTILVALGVYAEALVAPPLHFTLKGEVVPDTGEYPRPIIDPSSLPGSETLSCLDLSPQAPGPVIEDMVFRNGAQMYPHADTVAGGIRGRAYGITLRRCVFDSTFRTFGQWWYPWEPIVLTITDCIFRDQQRAGFIDIDYPLIATNCQFIGGNAFYLCVAGAGSQIRNCRVLGPNSGAHGMMVNGDQSEVTGCVFGPAAGSSNWPFILAQDTSGAWIHDNLFTGLTGPMAALAGTAYGANAFLIENNVFLNIQSVSGAVRLDYDWQGYHPGWGGTVRSNVFVNCFGQRDSANAIYVLEDDVLSRNRFVENTLDPEGAPTIRLRNTQSATLRDNLFEHTGFALENDGSAAINADSNWWGDPTGPYHATQNPSGQGDTIVGNVDFIPWYPDTSFLLNVPGLGRPLPKEFVLEAYPNPFNNVLHLTLIPSEVGIVNVELFDLLGRKVREIWSGPLAFQKGINFDASAFASGIYFARVTDVLSRKSLAMRKLVLLK